MNAPGDAPTLPLEGIASTQLAGGLSGVLGSATLESETNGQNRQRGVELSFKPVSRTCGRPLLALICSPKCGISVQYEQEQKSTLLGLRLFAQTPPMTTHI